jgi:hypothetical protein
MTEPAAGGRPLPSQGALAVLLQAASATAAAAAMASGQALLLAGTATTAQLAMTRAAAARAASAGPGRVGRRIRRGRQGGGTVLRQGHTMEAQTAGRLTAADSVAAVLAPAAPAAAQAAATASPPTEAAQAAGMAVRQATGILTSAGAAASGALGAATSLAGARAGESAPAQRGQMGGGQAVAVRAGTLVQGLLGLPGGLLGGVGAARAAAGAGAGGAALHLARPPRLAAAAEERTVGAATAGSGPPPPPAPSVAPPPDPPPRALGRRAADEAAAPAAVAAPLLTTGAAALAPPALAPDLDHPPLALTPALGRARAAAGLPAATALQQPVRHHQPARATMLRRPRTIDGLSQERIPTQFGPVVRRGRVSSRSLAMICGLPPTCADVGSGTTPRAFYAPPSRPVVAVCVGVARVAHGVDKLHVQNEERCIVGSLNCKHPLCSSNEHEQH